MDKMTNKKRVVCKVCGKRHLVLAREVAWGKADWVCEACNDRDIARDNARAYADQA